jgi:cyanate permease
MNAVKKYLQPVTPYRWLILFMGWLIYFSFGLISTSIAPLVAPIMLDLDLSYTQMGIITGTWQLMYILTAQPLGMMIDNLGVYKSLFLGSLLISVSSLIRAFVTGFWGLFASVALFGFGGPLVSIGTPKLISIWFMGEERGTASGINASGSSVGSVTALAFTNSVILPSVGNWRGVFLGYGFLGVILTFIWVILGRRTPPLEIQQTIQLPEKENMRKKLSLHEYRDIWIIVGIGVVSFFTIHALNNWLPSMLEFRGFSPSQAGYATSIMTLSGIFGSLVVPRASYKVNSRKMLLATLLSTLGVSILLTGLGGSVYLWFGLISTGFMMRALTPLLLLMFMEMPEVGSEHMGFVGGLYFSLGEIGGFLGPFMMGYLRDLTGSFIFGIYVLTLVALSAMITLPFMRKGN